MRKSAKVYRNILSWLLAFEVFLFVTSVATVSYIANSILRLSNRLKRYLYGKHYYALSTTNTTIILWYTIYSCLYISFQRSDISNWIIHLLYVRYCIRTLITYEISQKIRDNWHKFFHVPVREGDPVVLLCLESNQSLVVWLHKGNNQISEVKTVCTLYKEAIFVSWKFGKTIYLWSVNVPLESDKQKYLGEKNLLFVGILKGTEEKVRILILDP